MTVAELIERARAGEVYELELLSLEGGLYLLRAHLPDGLRTVHDAHGQGLHVRSSTELRGLLHGVPPLPCVLVQSVAHDEMCGQRTQPIEPLRVPLSLVEPW